MAAVTVKKLYPAAKRLSNNGAALRSGMASHNYRYIASPRRTAASWHLLPSSVASERRRSSLPLAGVATA